MRSIRTVVSALIALGASLFSQQSSNIFQAIPNTADTSTGEVRFLEKRSNGTNYFSFKAPTSMSGNILVTPFLSLPASTECVTLSSTGQMATASCASMTDLQVTRTSSTVLNIAAGSARIGSVTTAYSAATATLSGSVASSTAYVYVSSAGVLTVGHNGAATVTCSGCTTATGVSAFPSDSLPVATATYTSSAWDVSGISDKRAFLSRSPVASGDGIALTYAPTGATTVSTDSATVPRYSTGSGVPSASCTQGRDFYLDTATSTLYQCTATNTWGAVSGGSSAPDPSILTLVDEFCGTATAQFTLNWTLVGNGTDTGQLSNSSFDHPCVANMNHVGANNTSAYVLRYISTNNNADYGVWSGWTTKANQEYIFIIRTDDLNEMKFRIGLASGVTEAQPTDGIFVEYNNNTLCTNTGSDSTWKYYTRASSVSSSANGPAIAQYTWYKFRIRSTVAGTWLFSTSTNGGAYSAEQSLSTNVPTARLSPVFQVVSCSAGNYARMDVDYFSARATGVSR